MREIKLGNSELWAIVDDEDYDEINKYCWTLIKDGRQNYAVRSIKKNKKDGSEYWSIVKMHKIITGYDKTDHADHNGLNNQRGNLRQTTESKNGANRLKNAVPGYSRYKGVSWHKRDNKW